MSVVTQRLQLDFKQRGFFLIDALKCRINKKGKQIPKKVVTNCLGILKLEIELLSKSTNVKRIVVLGKTALEALKMLGFSELEGYSITNNCGDMVKSKGFEIFLCTLPFDRNKRYWDVPKVKEDLKLFVK